MPSGRFVRTVRKTALIAAIAAVALIAPPTSKGATANAYMVTPLVSDVPGGAPTFDPVLLNAWGLAAGPTSPWWVSDNGADASTLYTATGSKIPLTVGVLGGPTGVVFNGFSGNFRVGPSGATARFIFSAEDGTIRGWAPGLSTAVVAVDEGDQGAVYKGLAITMSASGPRIYATDFVRGVIDVYDGTWADVDTSGGFVDAAMPAGYGPFGIQAIGDRIFVTYAKQSGGNDELHGQGFGFVDAFDTDGNLLARVAQHGQLNAPWGLAMAPANFGRFSGDLLVGNFADGHVNAYEEMANGHFEFRGYLRMGNGGPVAIDGLWALEFGLGAPNNGATNTLFFTAGPNDEADGLFGTITAM